MNWKFIFTLLAFTIFFIGASYALFTYLRMRYSRLRKKIYKRLAAINDAQAFKTLSSNPSDVFSSNPKLNAWLKNQTWCIWLNSSFHKLRWRIRVDQYLALTMILFLLMALLIANLGGSLPLSMLLALIIASAPTFYLKVLLNKRQQKLEIQLPEILNFISRAMQAGHTFIGSMQMAAAESQDPIASEFQRAFQEIGFGRTVQESMADLSRRIDCAEMRYFAVAVFINQEIGGNLASLINGVATLIRERIKAKMILHAMTSEARTSAWILSSLPFFVAGAMALIRPNFLLTLWVDPTGRAMIGYALVLMFVGIVWMQRMAKIRV
ncbi:tight adherence protein B [Polynucleobacter sphagniphilus]|jgi:tight adherence protein B|uniref:Tight adherence protein B n=1 Tax=Polynucleobacter sphagniphilus TaxID=1743169 RepID=A0AA43MBI3_9BURK|nr:type II secretion system F family protein [Polynucleobacter sphagniphilus]MDF9788169.1 tight adherence protein B [Polynucleobacter sphagniphilus]MDH6302404.1 tight adherence protein B [Polynucleobacter sphagniphilus]MDH6504277.1 tight adherence protein B [Polynucleobacter sphagniphilus]MDH6512165.1 tight adherence protein B [Polynucleobacter sphagniphilus]